jgi:DNA-binding transcriptional ArsR family regulator
MRLVLALLVLVAALPTASAAVALRADPPALLLTPGGAATVGLVVTNLDPAAPVEARVTSRDVRFPADGAPGDGISVRTGDEAAMSVLVPPGGSARVEALVGASSRSAAGGVGDVVFVATTREGESATATVHVEVGDVPPAKRVSQLLAATALGGLAAAASGVIAFSPAPLYSRLRRADALAQPTRRRVYEAIAAEPGIGYAALMARTSLGAGPLVHHLRVLEGAGLVASRRQRGRRRLFPVG